MKFTIAALSIAALCQLGCARELTGEDPPLDRPHFPLGLAVQPGANTLAVVSSNFDLEFNRGALLVADLDVVDAAIANADDVIVVEDAYTAAAFLPSFGARPAFVPSGERLLLATRDENRVVEIGTSDPLAPECGNASAVPECGDAPFALQVPANDPFDVVVLSETDAGVVRSATSLLSSPSVFFFELDPARDDARRMRFLSPTLELGSWLTEGDTVIGVRAMVLVEERDGVPAHLFAAVERTRNSGVSVDLVGFQARPDPPSFSFLSLEDSTLAIAARGLAATRTGLLALMRTPDGLAKVALNPDGDRWSFEVTQIAQTCVDPASITVASFDALDALGGPITVERAFVTCLENDALLVYDTETLLETDAARFFGRGPIGVAVDTEHAPPRAYVAHFLDDTVGVFDLTDDAGRPKLVPRARLGVPRPAPEDGR